jgi:hypothetical protein
VALAGINPPASCACDVANTDVCLPTAVFKWGCYDEFVTFFEDHGNALGIIAIVFAVAEVQNIALF